MKRINNDAPIRAHAAPYIRKLCGTVQDWFI